MEVLRPQEDRSSIPGPSKFPSQEQLFHGQRAFSRHTWILMRPGNTFVGGCIPME